MPPKKKNISFGNGINADRFLKGIDNPSQPEDTEFLGEFNRGRRETEKAKETAVPLPIVGDTDLKIPPFFITKIEDKKRKYGDTGNAIKWRLVNPLTLARTLATRKHKKSINIERQNVDSPEISMRGGEEAPKLIEFSSTDQKRIINYFEKVKRGEVEEYTFKNKPHGFPCYMYKNCAKAGLKKKDQVNPKKVKTGSKVRGRPPTTLRINQQGNYIKQPPTEPRSVSQKPVLEFDPSDNIEEVADAIDEWYSKMKDFVPTKEELSRIAKYYNKDRNDTKKYEKGRSGEERIQSKKIYDIYKALQSKHYPTGHGLDPLDKFSGQGTPEEQDTLDEMDGLGLESACWKGYEAIGMKKKGKRMVPNCVPSGGSLKAGVLKDLLNASYDSKIEQVGDFQLDKEISSKTSKVYFNKNTGQAVVAHMGTQGVLDWGNNAVYAVGGLKAYKLTPRFKEAERVQQRAEEKYGAKNVSTIAHSQGGIQAELLGKNSKEIITFNKATIPFENTKNENQTDIRTTGDVVSALNPFQKKNEKEIVIKSKTNNPITEHSIDNLDNLDKDQLIGHGIKNKISPKNIMPVHRKQRYIDSDSESDSESSSDSDEEMYRGRPLGSDPRTYTPHPAMVSNRPDFTTLPRQKYYPSIEGSGLGGGIHHHHHYHVNQHGAGIEDLFGLGNLMKGSGFASEEEFQAQQRYRKAHPEAITLLGMKGMGLFDFLDPKKNGVAQAFAPIAEAFAPVVDKAKDVVEARIEDYKTNPAFIIDDIKNNPYSGNPIRGIISEDPQVELNKYLSGKETAYEGGVRSFKDMIGGGGRPRSKSRRYIDPNKFAKKISKSRAEGERLARASADMDREHSRMTAEDVPAPNTKFVRKKNEVAETRERVNMSGNDPKSPLYGKGVRKGRFVKGSKEARDYMASLRNKKGSKGGAIPAPPSRSFITDPSLMR